jgi:stage V sporulation protein D (sporulation-specific penicillin-binding protein)
MSKNESKRESLGEVDYLTRKRIIKILVGLAVFLSFLICNLFSLQIVNYGVYRDKVYDQITTSSSMRAKRGNIYDSNMNLLATDSTVFRIFVSSREIKKKSKKENRDYANIICLGLSDILNVDYAETLKKISNSNVLDITVKKNASEEEYEKIIEFIKREKVEDCVFFEAQVSRYYPEGTLAAHALGFTGSDLQGLYGLEYYYNSLLQGTDGYYLYAKDANGNALPIEYSTYIPSIDGCSLVTTIDSYVQRELESQIEAIRINHSVENRVTGIVMDTKTGAILGMATTTPFDPNSPYTLDFLSQCKLDSSGYEAGSDEYKSYKKELLEQMWANKAVSETYEPGSTFKIVTVSAALDSGSSKVTDSFSCHGYLQVGGWRIKCHKTTGHGSGFSLGYGLQMSCNPTMMTIAERMGAETFYEYVEKFGYFEKTGIDLPSEAATIFHKPENIGTTELATASFGQRFKVSVIRQLTSLAAVANGGELVTPYLVEKIIDSEGNVIQTHETEIRRRVVSSEVANTVAAILEEGVSGDGGAKNARVDGYKVAAKTGTSQKFDVLDENGNSYLRIGSTVAFSLSDEGGIAVIIVVDEPTSAVKYGSVVAAPYISAFLTKALPYLGYQSSIEKEYVISKDFTGLSITEAIKALKAEGISYEVRGGGDFVTSQTPPSGIEIDPKTSKIILYTDESSKQFVEVPNLVGMEASEANKLLSNLHFNIKFEGVTADFGGAVIISQSLAPNSVVPTGTQIIIQIRYMDFED